MFVSISNYLCSGQISFLSGSAREAMHCNVFVGYFETVSTATIRSSPKIRLKDFIITGGIVCHKERLNTIVKILKSNSLNDI
jgi:hypothetical protein